MAITPVNNHIYPENTYLKTDTTSSHGSSDGFSLEQALQGKTDREGVVYEPDHKASTPRQTDPHLTGNAVPTETSETDHFEKAEELPIFGGFSFTRLLDSLRQVFRYLGTNLSKIFSNIWESKPLTEGTDAFGKDDSSSASGQAIPSVYENTAGSEDAFDQAIARLEASGEWNEDEAIKKALDQGDDETFRTLISQGGRKTPARNTSVLTTYNASGKLVQMDPSNENRILRGDRGSRKS
jgi:hypothetical protein